MMEKPLTWLLIIGLVLLFINGCWTIGILIAIQSQRLELFLRTIILTVNILANVSFLISILISAFGLAEIIKEEKARKFTTYVLAIGIIFLIISIILFLCIIVTRFPWVYD
ncbi:MAG: hypothetical protein QXR03_02020 [Candidatus Aenigmatarchaeota archaeon]